jgi:hypothetical protein
LKRSARHKRIAPPQASLIGITGTPNELQDAWLPRDDRDGSLAALLNAELTPPDAPSRRGYWACRA